MRLRFAATQCPLKFHAVTATFGRPERYDSGLALADSRWQSGATNHVERATRTLIASGADPICRSAATWSVPWLEGFERCGSRWYRSYVHWNDPSGRYVGFGG